MSSATPGPASAWRSSRSWAAAPASRCGTSGASKGRRIAPAMPSRPGAASRPPAAPRSARCSALPRSTGSVSLPKMGLSRRLDRLQLRPRRKPRSVRRHGPRRRRPTASAPIGQPATLRPCGTKPPTRGSRPISAARACEGTGSATWPTARCWYRRATPTGRCRTCNASRRTSPRATRRRSASCLAPASRACGTSWVRSTAPRRCW